MTTLPTTTAKKLGLVIDLDTCVGCQACATSCKEWNTQGYSAPLTDENPRGADPLGVWLNRIHGYEVPEEGRDASRIVNFPRSCLHCETPACVTVCPTGASYKRAEDGIVLVNPDTCIGCKLCSWACPYGAREFDQSHGIMKKCTLCVDRIYNENFEVEDRVPACVKACPTSARHFGDFADPNSNVSILTRERGGYDLLPEMGTKPVNKYLPPRKRRDDTTLQPEQLPVSDGSAMDRLFAWSDSFLTARGKPKAQSKKTTSDTVKSLAKTLTSAAKSVAQSVTKAAKKPTTTKH
jgi:sulfite dehydrogenase (quinone) subunit SoeB